MGILIKAELRKMLLKKGVIITWILALLLGNGLVVQSGTTGEVYSDIFFKSFGYTPIMGLIMFMILSASYTLEYNSNMADLVNTTQNGKKHVAIAKGIAAGIATSIVNLSIIIVIALSGMRKTGFKELNMPLKELWYFKGVTSNLNVSQMIIILFTTVIIASFFFSQLGLYLSSISKSATMPFIVGGLIMGLPYILQAFLADKYLIVTPLFGMMSSELVRLNASLPILIIQGVILIGGCLIFIKPTYNAFTRENKN